MIARSWSRAEIDARGQSIASAPCPGDGAMLSGVLEMGGSGHLPLDRWFAPFATVIVGLVALIALLPRRILGLAPEPKGA